MPEARQDSLDVEDSHHAASGPTTGSLLEFLASQQSNKLDATQRGVLTECILQSRLSAVLVCFPQVAILATAILAFITDYSTIGYTRTGAWAGSAILIVSSFGASVLLALIMVPFSRLGRV